MAPPPAPTSSSSLDRAAFILGVVGLVAMIVECIASILSVMGLRGGYSVVHDAKTASLIFLACGGFIGFIANIFLIIGSKTHGRNLLLTHLVLNPLVAVLHAVALVLTAVMLVSGFHSLPRGGFIVLFAFFLVVSYAMVVVLLYTQFVVARLYTELKKTKASTKGGGNGGGGDGGDGDGDGGGDGNDSRMVLE